MGHFYYGWLLFQALSHVLGCGTPYSIQRQIDKGTGEI